MNLPIQLSEKNNSSTHRPDYLKGFAAGMIGGLVGTLVKRIAEKIAPTRSVDATSAPVRLADKVKLEVVGTHLAEENEFLAQQAIYWSFGTLVGGAYGAVAERSPNTASAAGLPFGSAVWTATHRAILPLLDLAPEPRRKTVERQVNAFAGHLLYGLTVELVRRQVRKYL